jgi:hypothetical protein
MYLYNGVGRPIRYWTGWFYSINWLLVNGWYDLLEQLLKGRPAFKVLHIQSKSLLWKWHNRKTTILWMWSSKLLRHTGLAILCNNSTWWTMCTPNLWDADRYILEKESEAKYKGSVGKKKGPHIAKKKRKARREKRFLSSTQHQETRRALYLSINRTTLHN